MADAWLLPDPGSQNHLPKALLQLATFELQPNPIKLPYSTTTYFAVALELGRKRSRLPAEF
jgi:hypothetical protein